jgi:sterol desaturase/sphingolipid hydroxylase (fatty acid hydroxylase superfamily)
LDGACFANRDGSIPVIEEPAHAEAILAGLAHYASTLASYPLSQSLWHAVKMLAGLFVAIFVLEMVTGGNVRRYLTRNFRTDVTYGIFYMGGIYNALIYAPLVAGLALIIPAWDFRLLNYVPGPLGFVIYWVLADAAGYWVHRWYHRNPILWEFHKVHHTQTELTFVTSWRNHVVEQLVSNIVLFVPLMVLGLPTWYWAPVFSVQLVFEGLQHADLNWRFGWLYPIVVSPSFHAIHHAPDLEHNTSNYAKILSIWDYVFGTISAAARPTRYGLDGTDMPVSFWGTMAAPFISLWRKRPPFPIGRSGRNDARAIAE